MAGLGNGSSRRGSMTGSRVALPAGQQQTRQQDLACTEGGSLCLCLGSAAKCLLAAAPGQTAGWPPATNQAAGPGMHLRGLPVPGLRPRPSEGSTWPNSGMATSTVRMTEMASAKFFRMLSQYLTTCALGGGKGMGARAGSCEIQVARQAPQRAGHGQQPTRRRHWACLCMCSAAVCTASEVSPPPSPCR